MTLPSRCFRLSDPLVPGREAGLLSLDSSIRVRLGKNRLTSLSVLLRLLLPLSRFVDDRFEERLRRRGWVSSSTSIHSTPSDLAELSVWLRRLDARVGLELATSSAGRETISFGGACGEARFVGSG